MKPLSLLQAFEARAALGLLFLIFTLTAGAQERTYPPATQAEVNAGTIHTKFVAPDTLAGWTGGGGGGGGGVASNYDNMVGVLKTNGSHVTMIFSLTGTNDILNIVRTFNFLSNNWKGIITSAGLNITSGITNSSLTANSLVYSDANQKESSLANGAGVLTNNGSGGTGWSSKLPTLDGANVTNVNAGAVTAGVNITLTKTKDTTTGITNTVVAVSDPASFNQVNATNFFVATNDMSGVTVVDFTTGSEATYDGLAAGLTITGFQNTSAGAYNEKIIKIHASGNQTITFPASWRLAPSVTGTATNGDWTYYWIDVQLGHHTNVFELYVH